MPKRRLRAVLYIQFKRSGLLASGHGQPPYFYLGFAEIDQQAGGQAGGSQVIQALCDMTVMATRQQQPMI